MLFDITRIPKDTIKELFHNSTLLLWSTKKDRTIIECTDYDSQHGNFKAFEILAENTPWDSFSVVRKGYRKGVTCWNVVDQTSPLYSTLRGSKYRRELSYSTKKIYPYGARYELLPNPEIRDTFFLYKFNVISFGDMNESKKAEKSINIFCRSNGIHVGEVDGEGLWDTELYHMLGGWGTELSLEIYHLYLAKSKAPVLKKFIDQHFSNHNGRFIYQTEN